jgi:hypothetical protein
MELIKAIRYINPECEKFENLIPSEFIEFN